VKGYVAEKARGRFHRSFYRVRGGREPRRRIAMKGYVVRKGNRWYAVIYEGTDPGHRSRASQLARGGHQRADAERPAARLVADFVGRNVELHILPTLGRIGLRRLRPHHLEALSDRLLHPNDETAALAPKTVYEVHLVIRGALSDAVRRAS
jgi:hypothetical protein